MQPELKLSGPFLTHILLINRFRTLSFSQHDV
uniref:Uncharacterized protein n=1 Tax=Anguilla anguilla TaxID=7936 RepID=A0A0E9PK51_ANGAN